MNNQSPPAIAEPPPLPVPARKRPASLGIIIFAAGATVLTALNLLFGFLLAMSERPQGYSGEHYVTGYVSASVLTPAVIALLIAAIWKSNRRPFRLLVCYFWAALVMLISKNPADPRVGECRTTKRPKLSAPDCHGIVMWMRIL